MANYILANSTLNVFKVELEATMRTGWEANNTSQERLLYRWGIHLVWSNSVEELCIEIMSRYDDLPFLYYYIIAAVVLW